MAGQRKALIVVDMLNDFVRENGNLVVPAAKDIIPCIKKEIAEAREQNYPVIYLADNHKPDDPEFAMWPAHAVKGTWGAQVIDELKPQKGDFVIPKRRYSGFYNTDLDLTLRELSVDTLIITGTLTNICVYFTAADARSRYYNVIVPADCVASLSKETDRIFLGQMETVLGAKVVK